MDILHICVCVFFTTHIYINMTYIYTSRVGNRKQGQSKEQMGYCIYGTIAIAFQMLVSSLNPFTLPRSMGVTLNSWINPDATKKQPILFCIGNLEAFLLFALLNTMWNLPGDQSENYEQGLKKVGTKKSRLSSERFILQ